MMGMILGRRSSRLLLSRPRQAGFSGISLDIAAGEVVCVLGPNGVGKSTLLRCLAGLSAPSAGSVQLEGQPIAIAVARGHRAAAGAGAAEL